MVSVGQIGPIYQAVLKDGGGFGGVLARLPKLKQLNIKTIWLCGAMANHRGVTPFALMDPYEVEPRHGGPAGLRQLMTAGHNQGFYFMGDYIPNHVSRCSPLLGRHFDWFINFSHTGWIRNATDRAANPRDFDGTAQFNFLADSGLREYIIGAGTNMLDIGFDIIRIDAPLALLKCRMIENWYRGRADEVHQKFPKDFLQELIEAMKAHKPDTIILGEAFKDSNLQADVWRCGADLVYNNSWPYALFDIFRGQAPINQFDHLLWELKTRYWRQGHEFVNFKDGHDIRDIKTSDQGIKKPAFFSRAEMKVAATLVSCLPGVPLLFNGEPEAILGYGYDYENATPIDWSGPFDPEMAEFNALLSGIWARPLFREGGFDPLVTRDDCLSGGVRAFGRQYQNQKAVVALNFFSDYPGTAWRSFNVDVLLHNLGDERQVLVRDMLTRQIYQEPTVHELRTQGLKAGLSPLGSQILQLIPKE